MRISDWSSDVCSSDLIGDSEHGASPGPQVRLIRVSNISSTAWTRRAEALYAFWKMVMLASSSSRFTPASDWNRACRSSKKKVWRSEEHTSELQSLMRISYAVFCLKKKRQMTQTATIAEKKKAQTYI